MTGEMMKALLCERHGPPEDLILTDTLRPDVVIYDMPPALSSDDVIAFRAHFDAVLLVVGGGLTTDAEVKDVERRLGEQTPLLGMVLNRAEGTNPAKYAY